MKKYWLNILLYGGSLGLLLVALQVFKYKWVLVKNDLEGYVGAIALLFTAIGVWVGSRLLAKKAPLLPTAMPNDAAPDKALLTKHGLTPREYDVLQLMALGHSNQEIAGQLFVSLNTVKTHISSILSKLNAERRTQAVQKAKMLGLLS